MSRTLVVILIILAIIIVPVVLIGSWFARNYNQLVQLDEQVNGAWSQVENNYQRRSDLIPNLVETVKGAAAFEQETFTQVAEARARAGAIQMTPETLKDPAAFAKWDAAQGELSSALSRLLVTVERYPELKANQNFLDLQAQLEGTENRIAVSRQRFNETVQAFNARIRTFPTSIVASFTGFAQRPYFQSKPGADTAPAVKF
ncbi:MAG: LemA family protein [Acidobacteria bacterium]|jgi:LemA protein|nr:LemA family protein [Acidobacteriota bacterium]